MKDETATKCSIKIAAAVASTIILFCHVSHFFFYDTLNFIHKPHE